MAPETILVAVDGSDASLDAVSTGLALLSPDAHVVFVTVIEASDPTLVTGAGMAGGVMSADELEQIAAWVQQRIKTMVGVTTQVSVLAPDSIERTLVGKARRVIDKRSK